MSKLLLSNLMKMNWSHHTEIEYIIWKTWLSINKHITGRWTGWWIGRRVDRWIDRQTHSNIPPTMKLGLAWGGQLATKTSLLKWQLHSTIITLPGCSHVLYGLGSEVVGVELARVNMYGSGSVSINLLQFISDARSNWFPLTRFTNMV